MTVRKIILNFGIFSSIFWILGVSYLYSSYKIIKNTMEIANQGHKAMATITDVREYEESSGDGDYTNKRDVYVTYMADSQKYNSVFKDAGIRRRIGEQTEIYYDAEVPTVIVSWENTKEKVSFRILMGIILVLLPFVLLIGSKFVPQNQKTNDPQEYLKP